MANLKVAVVGAGSISQIVHLPVLKNLEDVEIAAICDKDKSKVNILSEKYNIPNWYFTIEDLFKNETLDAVHICTTNLCHFPMSYLALKKGAHVLVEKPIAINAEDAFKIQAIAEENKRTVMVGMHNRFRDDVKILHEFIKNDELGEIYYIKAGWLKSWSKNVIQPWVKSRDNAGGGVLLDIGSQLIDLALFLLGLPKIRSVRMYDYTIDPKAEVEEAALAVIETEAHTSITIEISWRMHMENDMIYTHLFGKKGSAYLNPLRIQKELHGNLVNVTPILAEKMPDRYKKAYEAEIKHFYKVIREEEENLSPAKDAVYVMRILNALYQSAKDKKEVYI
ncbi:MAG: Gfo/Idh/MocA family oxidoreductase [Calditrichaceae bacterium]|nr:Gfo/Idh/MocA family oxidoreductase [Calditrichaceae bacterium]HES59790.1 Gfo/Idh/MocA family oxidoreductase [Caldithrix sp.]